MTAKSGFEEVIKSNPNLKIIASQTGDFTRAKGKEVMQAFLKAHKKIDVLYAHNDDMALGAIQAIEAAGLEAGQRYHHYFQSMASKTALLQQAKAKSTLSSSVTRCSDHN